MQEIINISNPDDGLGDQLRTGFDKSNKNFTELYDKKVDKLAGFGLSENNFTDAEQLKLQGIESGAQVNVNADFAEENPSAPGYILNRPDISFVNFVEVTKDELNDLIAINGLARNATYSIRECDTDLYGGTRVYLRAINTEELDTSGVAEFFTPRYDRAVTNLGLYDWNLAYNINDTVIWGGKLWTAKMAVPATSQPSESLFLDTAFWDVETFSGSNYNVSFDIVTYDIKNDHISRREDNNGNIVEFSYASKLLFGANAINRFQWGLPYDALDGIGVYNNRVDNTVTDVINNNTDVLQNRTYSKTFPTTSTATTAIVKENGQWKEQTIVSGGGSQSLQQVTNVGSATTRDITVFTAGGAPSTEQFNRTRIAKGALEFTTTKDLGDLEYAPIKTLFKADFTTVADITLTLPKLSGTLARIEDLGGGLGLMREEFTFTSSQSFTLSNVPSNVVFVTVQGQSLSITQFSITGSTLTIIDTLDTSDRVVISYGFNFTGFVPTLEQVLAQGTALKPRYLNDTGWAQYTDTLKTVSAPFTIATGVTSILPCNGGTTIKTQMPLGFTNIFDTTTNKLIALRIDDKFLLNVRFKAKTSVTNDFFSIGIDIGSGPTVGAEDLIFTRGANTEQQFSIKIPYFTRSTFIANGGLIKVTARNGNLQIYDISIIPELTHKAF